MSDVCGSVRRENAILIAASLRAGVLPQGPSEGSAPTLPAA
jgi:hypothetical protein